MEYTVQHKENWICYEIETADKRKLKTIFTVSSYSVLLLCFCITIITLCCLQRFVLPVACTAGDNITFRSTVELFHEANSNKLNLNPKFKVYTFIETFLKRDLQFTIAFLYREPHKKLPTQNNSRNPYALYWKQVSNLPCNLWNLRRSFSQALVSNKWWRFGDLWSRILWCIGWTGSQNQFEWFVHKSFLCYWINSPFSNTVDSQCYQYS